MFESLRDFRQGRECTKVATAQERSFLFLLGEAISVETFERAFKGKLVGRATLDFDSITRDESRRICTTNEPKHLYVTIYVTRIYF